MIIKNNIGITTKEEWDNKWEGIFGHYQQDLRNSYYVNSMIRIKDKNILEIGAGSFRDMANLNQMGNNVSGCDYSEKTVEMAKKYFPQWSDKMFCGDGFNLPFKDKEFDFSYHNGLWVLFNDEDILKLATEQVRVTKNRIIITVHNAHNRQFVEYFEKLSNDDNLYQIRFFTVDEIENVLNKFCKKITIIPVGKGKKFFEDKLINEGFGQKEILKSFFDITKKEHLYTSERLMCIGDLF